jgi:hypothetical protein
LTIQRDLESVRRSEIVEEARSEAPQRIQVVVTIRQVHTSLIQGRIGNIHEARLIQLGSAQHIPKSRGANANLIHGKPRLTSKVVGVLAKSVKVIFSHSKWLSILVEVGLAFINHLGDRF